MSSAAQGQVFDLGYRRYEGPRAGRKRARLAIYKDGLRTAMGLGRGGRAKVPPWLFIAAMLIPAVVFALIAGAANRIAPDFDELDLPSHADYYAIAAIILLIFAAVVGPELLCSDRRDGVIHLYLVRPLTPGDYAGSRWAALVTIMVAAAWLPQLVLLAGLTLGDPDPGSYLAENWLDIPRFLAAGLALALYAATLAFLVASFTTRRAYAAVFLVGLFLISTAVIGSVAQTVDPDVARWIVLLSISDVPLYINDLVFNNRAPTSGRLAETTGFAQRLPNVVPVVWYVGLVALAGLIIRQRYRRFTG